MISLDRHSWVARTARTTAGCLALLAGASLGVYMAYFTPEKLAERQRLAAEKQRQETVEQRLAEADAKSVVALEARLKPLKDLFTRARRGATAFSEEALSWSSKWELLKGFVNDDDGHRQFIAEAFARHVLRTDELQAVMESVFRTYMDDIETCEAEMLVLLKADLADPTHPDLLLPAHLKGGEPFQREFGTLHDLVGNQLRFDLGVTVGRELGIMLASDVAARATLQAAEAAAAELGVSAGLIGAGAASSIATLGVGIVAAFILDYVVDEILKIVGYDPTEKISGLVCDSLNRLEAALIRQSHESTRGKAGSLRLQLEQLHTSRSQQRREQIDQLMNGGRIR